MEERTKYIHYGHSNFDRDLFVKPRNRMMFVKPFGGLWVSPVDAARGWRDWCEDENFHLENLGSSFTFTLRDGAMVAHIYDSEYLKELPGIENPISSWVCLDFEKMVELGYDAVELHLSEEKGCDNFLDGLYWRLYGWDCDSILILNPDVIIVEE